MKIKKYSEFLSESRIDTVISKMLDPERVEDLDQTMTQLIDFIQEELDEEGYDDDEIEEALKRWAKKHKVSIKESLNENSKNEKRNSLALEFLTWLPESSFQITAKGEFSLEIQGRHVWNIRIRSKSIVVKGQKNFEIIADEFTAIELISSIILSYENRK